jgi:catechol-2,3-dioxygenase
VIETQSPRLAVVSLRAEDLPTTVQFYQDVIGLHILPHHQPHPAFELENDVFLVILQGHPNPKPVSKEERFPAIAFVVDDLESVIEHLKSHDVALPWGIEERAGDRWVKFYDPAGNLIEIAQFSKLHEI